MKKFIVCIVCIVIFSSCMTTKAYGSTKKVIIESAGVEFFVPIGNHIFERGETLNHSVPTGAGFSIEDIEESFRIHPKLYAIFVSINKDVATNTFLYMDLNSPYRYYDMDNLSERDIEAIEERMLIPAAEAILEEMGKVYTYKPVVYKTEHETYLRLTATVILSGGTARADVFFTVVNGRVYTLINVLMYKVGITNIEMRVTAAVKDMQISRDFHTKQYGVFIETFIPLALVATMFVALAIYSKNRKIKEIESVVSKSMKTPNVNNGSPPFLVRDNKWLVPGDVLNDTEYSFVEKNLINKDGEGSD